MHAAPQGGLSSTEFVMKKHLRGLTVNLSSEENNASTV
jgi:hypothetical protein